MTDPVKDFDVSQFLPYLLNQTAEQTSRAFQEVYRARYGMQRTEWRVLFHLGQYGAMTAAGISRRAMIDKVKISRAVRALSDKDFLRRDRDARDGRAEILHLTPSGQAAFEDLRKEAESYECGLEEKLSAKDMAALKTALARLLDQS